MAPFRETPCPACQQPVRLARLRSVMAHLVLPFSALLGLLLPFLLFKTLPFGWMLPAVTASVILVHIPLAWACCRFVPLVAVQR